VDVTAADGPAVTVVVPTRDRPGPLAECLVALDAQRGAAVEVVVVDDASTDPVAVAAAVGGRDHVRLVRGTGAGPAAARNRGAAAAGGDVVCFTDDDCRPGPDWCRLLAGRIAAGTPAAAGPTRDGRPDDPWATASQIVTNHLVTSSLTPDGDAVGFAPTSNLAVRADVATALPFDESFPLAAGEDREWCLRLADRGHTLAWEPEAWVEHHQRLDARRFWRQQWRYGRGARRLRRTRPGTGYPPVSFYAELVRTGVAAGWRVGALVGVAQVATVAGAAHEAWTARRG
jgi:glycosyltransferase involved in cell wall biosynthesis